MKQPLIRKEHLGPENGQRDLPRDLRVEAERRLQLAQSGTLNGSIATAYALLAIHNTLRSALIHRRSSDLGHGPGDTSPVPRIPAQCLPPKTRSLLRSAARIGPSALVDLLRAVAETINPAAHTASGSR